MKWIRRNEKNKKKWSKYYEANSILPTVCVFWREETVNMYENESNEILSHRAISFTKPFREFFCSLLSKVLRK